MKDMIGKLKDLLGDNWKAAVISGIAVLLGVLVGAPGLTISAADALHGDDLRAEICGEAEAEAAEDE